MRRSRWFAGVVAGCAMRGPRGRRVARRGGADPAPITLSKALDLLENGTADSARMTSGAGTTTLIVRV